jgi:hypothetical protein
VKEKEKYFFELNKKSVRATVLSFVFLFFSFVVVFGVFARNDIQQFGY